jgi:hypothetical protein
MEKLLQPRFDLFWSESTRQIMVDSVSVVGEELARHSN